MSEAYPSSGMDYTQTQGYQRRLRKLSTAQPGTRAWLNTAYADRASASEEAQRELEALRMGAQKDAQDRSLALRQQDLDSRRSIFNDRMDFAQDQEGTAEKLGVLGVGVQGVTGAMEGEQARKRAKRLGALADMFGRS